MKSKGHIIKVDEEEKYGINLYFVLSTYRVLIELEDDYQIDLRNSNFRKLIGFNSKKLHKQSIEQIFQTSQEE